MNNILITGSNGQLGSELKKLSLFYPEYIFIFTDLSDLDITNFNYLKKFIIDNKINIIINCAAYTNVDKAENEFELADAVNHLGVKNLSIISKLESIKLIHISTDYIFDGKKVIPYVETDMPNPLSVYGKTKLDGEIAMKEVNPSRSIIIRTSWLYSNFGDNFVYKILSMSKNKQRLNIVSDQFGSPTYAVDLANVILKILPKIDNESVTTYHYCNQGVCSWFDLALEIIREKKIKSLVNPVRTSDFLTIANRPSYSAINNTKIKKCFKINVPHWKESLHLALKNIHN